MLEDQWVRQVQNTTWQTASELAFYQQLQHNINAIQSNQYPEHWIHNLHFLSIIENNIQRVVDIGCGACGMYGLISHLFPAIDYIGYDYAKSAINVAKKYWNTNKFFVMDLYNLDSSHILQKDVIIANAICDVSENGDDCLQKILSLKSDYVILNRLRITNKPSFYEKYIAYSEIDTVAFFHNQQTLYDVINEANYSIIKSKKWIQENIIDLLLERKNVSKI